MFGYGQSLITPLATSDNDTTTTNYHPKTSDNAVKTILIRAVARAVNPKSKRQIGTA
jgi:hypothetical protein